MYGSSSFFKIDRYNNFVIIKDLTIATIKIPAGYSIEISMNKEDFKEMRSELEKILTEYGIKYISVIPAKVFGSDPDIKELNNKNAIITENDDDNNNWLITNLNLRYYNPNLLKLRSIILKINLSGLFSPTYHNVPYL